MLMRLHAAFSVSVAEGDLDEANYYFDRLMVWAPKRFGLNPTLMLASIDMRMLASVQPKERMLSYFEQLASRALAKAPNSPYSYLLAAGLASQREPGGETCRDYLSQAIAAANRDVMVYRQAGHIQMAAGMYRDSMRYFSLFKNIAIIHRNKEAIIEANGLLARLYAQIEAAPSMAESQVIKHIDSVLELEESDIERVKAYIIKANEYARFHMFAQAAEVLREAYSRCEEDSKAAAMVLLVHPLVASLLGSGDTDGAEKVVSAAASLGTANLDIERAYIAHSRQQTEKAQKLLKSALADSDGTAATVMKIAMAYSRFGNATMAIALLEQLASKKIAPPEESTTVLSNSAVSEMSINDTVFFPFEPCVFGLRSINSELARCYEQQQRYSDAVIEWRKLVRKYPQNPVCKVELANALAKDGHEAEAAPLYRQAETRLMDLLEQAPSCPVFHFALGDIYRHDGDNVLAAFHYKMVVCEPYTERTSKAFGTLSLSNAQFHEQVAKRMLSMSADSDAKKSLAMFLAVHGQAAKKDRQSSLEAKPQT
ncbi:hypothetical protein IJT17_06715 [bacterium]|nr:hypothetical protein [bacterium]